MILIGDLGDINAIGRRDGFEEAVKARRMSSMSWRASHGMEQEKAQAAWSTRFRRTRHQLHLHLL